MNPSLHKTSSYISGHFITILDTPTPRLSHANGNESRLDFERFLHLNVKDIYRHCPDDTLCTLNTLVSVLPILYLCVQLLGLMFERLRSSTLRVFKLECCLGTCERKNRADGRDTFISFSC